MPAAGLGISPKTYPQALADGRVELLPGAVDAPKAKVMIDGLPRWEVVWQEPPGAAATDDVEDGVEYPRVEHGSGGRPAGFGAGRWGSMQAHWASDRSVWYAFLMLGILPSHRLRPPFQTVSQKALSAAEAQKATLPGEEVAACIVADLASEVLILKERVAKVEEELQRHFFAHPMAEILASLPGMGPILGAEFLVAVGDICAIENADRLAAYAGLVPAARDSGKRVGKHRRMRGGNKVLNRVLYQSAFASLRSSSESRAFYDRKRAEGKRHTQALIALARRRVSSEGRAHFFTTEGGHQEIQENEIAFLAVQGA